MPDKNPTHVLTIDAVRWGIDTLGAQKIHPTFAVYLYLRAQARAGELETASATSDELLALIEMPGNPRRPYYFPFISRGKREDGLLTTFWRAKNIAGSWSPGSIYRQQSGSWLGTSDGRYAMPANHIDLALEQMLYGHPVPALAIGAYFLRNDGFVLSGEPTAEDLVTAMRSKFDFPQDADDEFYRLFSESEADVNFKWFEIYAGSTDTGVLESEEMIDA